jgi:hypothetical protein
VDLYNTVMAPFNIDGMNRVNRHGPSTSSLFSCGGGACMYGAVDGATGCSVADVAPSPPPIIVASIIICQALRNGAAQEAEGAIVQVAEELGDHEVGGSGDNALVRLAVRAPGCSGASNLKSRLESRSELQVRTTTKRRDQRGGRLLPA